MNTPMNPHRMSLKDIQDSMANDAMQIARKLLAAEHAMVRLMSVAMKMDHSVCTSADYSQIAVRRACAILSEDARMDARMDRVRHAARQAGMRIMNALIDIETGKRVLEDPLKVGMWALWKAESEPLPDACLAISSEE